MGWHYIETGNHDLPTIVFLHGFMGSGRDWEAITSSLEDKYHCLAYDLPGHGTTDLMNIGKTLSVESTARAIAEDVKSRGLNKIIPVGYSLGGRIALAMSVLFPESVRALVLESANPGIEDGHECAARAKLDDIKASELRKVGIARFLDKWYEQPLFSSLKRNPNLLAELKRSRTGSDPESLAQALSALSVGRQLSYWSKLEEVDIPVLLLTGRLDEKYREIALRMKSKIPDSRWEVIDGAGHNTHLEKPDRFVGILKDFLETLEEGRGSDSERKRHE